MNLIEQNIYLELLRASLWERTPDLSVFHGDWSWTPILDAFINHDQLGIVANTIALLPSSIPHSGASGSLSTGEGGGRGSHSGVCRPSPFKGERGEGLGGRGPLYQYVGSLIKSHHLLNTRLRDIMPQLEAAGCHPVLLKGQGLSTLYPKTCLRSCGDLDIYVGEENMDKAKAIVNAMATKEEIEQAEDSTHHYHIDLEGVTYEIHRYPGDAGNKQYQDAYIALSTPCLQPDQCEQVTLAIGKDNIQVRVPSLDFNVWYIFNHIVTHFSEGGVGLRQFSDWLMVLREWNKRGSASAQEFTNSQILDRQNSTSANPCQSEKSVGQEEQAQATTINDNSCCWQAAKPMTRLINDNSCKTSASANPCQSEKSVGQEEILKFSNSGQETSASDNPCQSKKSVVVPKSPFRSAFGRFDKVCDSLGDSHSAPAQVPLQGGFRGSRDLEGLLQSIGLFRPWQILGGILVYQLGLPQEEFPLFNARMARKSQGFILKEIMGGNRFRLASLASLGQQGHGLNHIKYNLLFYYNMSRSLYLFSPWAPYKSMWNWLTGGLTHALTGKA